MEAVAEKLNQAIDEAEALFKAHGITSVATYDTVPLDVAVGVLSSSGRRYLEVLGKLDQLMPLLQTLEIHEVMSPQEVDVQRAALKRQVRDVANGTRNFATGLRRRMNALGGRDARSEDTGTADAAGDAEETSPSTDLAVPGAVSVDGVDPITPVSEVIAEN
jgi:hypothetical protein